MTFAPLAVAIILSSGGGIPDDLPAELHTVRDRVRAVDLQGAEEAYREGRKALKDRLREKEVRAGLRAVKRQISALREYERARALAEKGRFSRALGSMARVLRGYGETWFDEKAEKLYTEVKGKVCLVINDFESPASRIGGCSGSTRPLVLAKVVRDIRVAADGRHALKVHFEARRPGVDRKASQAIRAITLRPPTELSEKMEGARALTFSVYSYGMDHDKITVEVIDTYGCRAEYPGIALNYVGHRTFTLRFNRFRDACTVDWGKIRKVRFSTRDPGAMDFALDDVRIVK